MPQGQPRHFYIVDDDRAALAMLRALFEDAGHRVTVDSATAGAAERIAAQRPDCVLLDIMMPGLDGLSLCRLLRRDASLEGCKLVFLTGKAYAADRLRAMESGADGYFVKPIDPNRFPGQLDEILTAKVRVTFWGCRGTLPVPGPRSLKYGGNTPCVTVELPGDLLFILDAGTGIKELSNHLVAEQARRINAKILITHPHWDHINALPHFAPLYAAGHEIEICGARQGEIGVRQLLLAQMDGVYFPVTEREFAARVRFRDVDEGRHEIGDVPVRTMLLRHPGSCLGYRIDYKRRSVCYVTDNELYSDPHEAHELRYVRALTDFTRGADALIIDCTYLDDEYPAKVGWGHSCVSQVVDLAHEAGVLNLYLFHHDPDQSDEDIDRKLETALEGLAQRDSSTLCFAAAERDELVL